MTEYRASSCSLSVWFFMTPDAQGGPGFLVFSIRERNVFSTLCLSVIDSFSRWLMRFPSPIEALRAQINRGTYTLDSITLKQVYTDS